MDFAVDVRFTHAPCNQLGDLRTEVENQDFVVHGCGRDEENKKSSASSAASKAWTAASGGRRHARRIAGQSCIGGRSSRATPPLDDAREPDEAGDDPAGA
ncbi:hypothetical protein, partial [Burkholderia cenocepacia]